MQVIRKEQMEALSAYMRQNFEDRMVGHIATDFPKQFERMKEEGAREFVRAGVERCAGHGIGTEGGIRFVVDLLLQHPDFDAARDLAWARTILQDAELSGQAKVSLIEQRLESMKSRNKA